MPRVSNLPGGGKHGSLAHQSEVTADQGLRFTLHFLDTLRYNLVYGSLR